MSAKVTAFFLGGTISVAAQTAGQHSVDLRLGARELVAAVPQLETLDVALSTEQFRNVASAALSFDDIVELVGAAAAAACDGVVVVQGTDTIEETAYLIDLLWADERPVVVTGAMRNPNLAGPDGPANLLAAVSVAASPAFRGLGALVVFDDQVHAARFVRKTHSTSTATFVSADAGPLGQFIEGTAIRLAGVTRRPTYILDRAVRARVPIVNLGMDDGGELLDGLPGRVDGLVVAALGAGHVPPRLVEPLADLAARIPVVLASRAGAGSVLRHTYAYPGSERDLIGRGLIPARLLHPAKARVLLRVLLAGGAEPERIRSAFDVAVCE